MTTIERILELDRLYLVADRAMWQWMRADESARERLYRFQRRAWARYYRLRDSKKGLPRRRAVEGAK